MPKANKLPQNEGQIDYPHIRKRIHDILQVYGRASPTMLQAALGAYVKPATWRPVMDDMIKRNEITLTVEMLDGKTFKILELVN